TAAGADRRPAAPGLPCRRRRAGTQRARLLHRRPRRPPPPPLDAGARPWADSRTGLRLGTAWLRLPRQRRQPAGRVRSLLRHGLLDQRVVQRRRAPARLARAEAFGPGCEGRAFADRAERELEIHLAADI